MIEIEKNFDLLPGEKEKIIKDAQLIGRKKFTDIYYDTADFYFTRQDYWLRERDGRWELKVPIITVATRDSAIDRYNELENEKDIIKELKLPRSKSLGESLREKGVEPFATIVTNRKTYHKGDFHLDFDEMDFGFTTFEVELMVPHENDVPNAENKIVEFARVYGIDSTKGRGKVIQYLFMKNPKHFRALLDAGVIRE